MTPDESRALRVLAGLDDGDGDGARAYRFRTSYVPQSLVVAFALWLLPIFALNSMPPNRDLVVPVGCGSLFVLFAGALWFFRRRARRLDAARDTETHSRYAADLIDQQIDEYRLRVVKAIEVEEFEDEGMQFYLELEDGRILFIMSQQFYHEEEYHGRFPSTEVLVTRLPHADEVIGLEPVGDHLPVSAEWPSFTADDYKNGRVPQHGALLPGPLSRYRRVHMGN
jgi:hypothetical protein